MKNEIKNIIEVSVSEGAQARAERAAARLEADEQLAENAKIRLGDVKIEKWWSVAAGMALVAAFILYTCYLTIPALILLGLLAAFLIYVFIHLRTERKKIENAEPEISPNRCVDVFMKKALGQSVTGRDVSAYMDAADIVAFGTALRAKLADMGFGADVAIEKVNVKVTETEQLSEKCGQIPVSVIIACGSEKAEIRWVGTFALSATGDCMLDTKLVVEG